MGSTYEVVPTWCQLGDKLAKIHQSEMKLMMQYFPSTGYEQGIGAATILHKCVVSTSIMKAGLLF